VATEQGRADVARLVLANIDQALIARCLRISEPVLRRAYRRELDTSYALITADIAGKLVTRARGTPANPGGELKAQIFYLETHGWVRSERLVVADGDGDDPTKMTDAEIEARLRKLSARRERRR
jgi:hypothetical protein